MRAGEVLFRLVGETACSLIAGLLKKLLSYRELFDSFEIGKVDRSRVPWNPDRPLRAHCHFGINNVLQPVPAAGGDISGKTKPGQRGERNIACAPNA
jgi:hypothetical protein